jgi:hypothetical protein
MPITQQMIDDLMNSKFSDGSHQQESLALLEAAKHSEAVASAVVKLQQDDRSEEARLFSAFCLGLTLGFNLQELEKSNHYDN